MLIRNQIRRHFSNYLLSQFFLMCQPKKPNEELESTLQNQGIIKEKIESENGPFTKIGDLKTDALQKSATLKLTLHKNQRLKNGPQN